MKTFYALFLTLCLFFFGTSATFAGSTICENNFTPVFTLSPTCGSTINALVGTQVAIIGTIIDPNIGDVISLTGQGVPATASMTPPLPASGNNLGFIFTWTPTDVYDGVTIPISFIATDLCGATAICTFNIQVTCATLIVNCPGDTTIQATGPNCSAVFTYVASASSASGITDFTATPASGSTFTGKTTVVATATDGCGNTATCSFDVTVENASPPTVSCPANITAQSGSLCGATVSYVASASSAAGLTSFVAVPPPGSFFPVGVTTVTATATDNCGSTAACSFTVTVTGSTPDIDCPPDITVAPNTGTCSAIVNYNIETDDPLSDILTSTPPSGSAFPLGTTTVNASVTDECGATASCSFTVTVTSSLTVNAGPDVSTVFGYPSTQTATNTAVASGGTAPYSYRWTLNRPLKCNQVNSAGDELFTGGTCTNNICPGSASVTPAAPACTSSATINATLLADATACVTVTDANGCTATECFEIAAVDGRCFSGASGKKKTKVCHRTGSASNPWIQICVDKGALAAHLAHNPDDKVGPCPSGASRTALLEEDETFLLYPNPVGSELTLDFVSEGIRAVQLFNTMGKLLFETTSDWEQLKMDMTGFAKGIYFISVRDEDNNVTVKKFVKM